MVGWLCLGETGGGLGLGKEGTEIKGLFPSLLLGLCFEKVWLLGSNRLRLESCLCPLCGFGQVAYPL